MDDGMNHPRCSGPCHRRFDKIKDKKKYNGITEGTMICRNCYKTKSEWTMDIVIEEVVDSPTIIEQPSSQVILPRSQSTPRVSILQPIDDFMASQSTASDFMDSQCSSNQESVVIKARSVPTTERRCLICLDGNGRTRIPVPEISRLFNQFKVVIPNGSRVCDHHLIHGQLRSDSVQSILNNVQMRLIELNVDDASRLLESSLGFKSSPADAMTGIPLDCLDDILATTTSLEMATSIKMLLVKLKTNQTDQELEYLFSIDRRTVSRRISEAREHLISEYVPKWLGISHLSRESLLQRHTTRSSRALLELESDQTAVIIDGTYFYTQQPQDHDLMKELYCNHKGRTCTKPTPIVASDGYILECTDLYVSDAKHDDGSIIIDYFKNHPEWNQYLIPGDAVVFDRGYNRTHKYFNERGLKTFMPAFLLKGTKQLPADVANQSRITTRCRFIIENRNKNFKQFKFLGSTIHNVNYRHLNDYFRIVAAILNHTGISTMNESDRHFEVSKRIKERQTKPNLILGMGDQLSLTKSSKWDIVDADSLDSFPQIDINEIIDHITLGPYQVSLSHSYIVRHMRESMIASNDEFKFKLSLLKVEIEGNHFIAARVHSKFTMAKFHRLVIGFKAGINNPSGITHHWCNCKAGARTSGCCSHVAAIICYLSYYKNHQDKINLDAPHAGIFKRINAVEVSDATVDTVEVIDEESESEREDGNNDSGDEGMETDAIDELITFAFGDF